jgi:hypothetical protein
MADHSLGNIDERPFTRANNSVLKYCRTKYPVIFQIFDSGSLKLRTKEKGHLKITRAKRAD